MRKVKLFCLLLIMLLVLLNCTCDNIINPTVYESQEQEGVKITFKVEGDFEEVRNVRYINEDHTYIGNMVYVGWEYEEFYNVGDSLYIRLEVQKGDTLKLQLFKSGQLVESVDCIGYGDTDYFLIKGKV